MRSGGLFAGYGGLDMAVTEVFGAEPAWFSEIDEVNRNAQLKALGNGVVPQQAVAALRHMHTNHELMASA